jgi:hypothetical protein
MAKLVNKKGNLKLSRRLASEIWAEMATDRIAHEIPNSLWALLEVGLSRIAFLC